MKSGTDLHHGTKQTAARGRTAVRAPFDYRPLLLGGVALLPACLLLLPDVAEVLYTLLCAAGLVLLIHKGWHHPDNRKVLLPTLLTLAFFAAAALSIAVSGDYSGWFRPLKKLSELAATPLLALLLVHAGAGLRFMLQTIRITVVLLFLVAVAESFGGMARPGGAVSPLVFGHVAVLLGFFSLVPVPLEHRMQRLWSLVAFLCGITAAMISQSRITLIEAIFLGLNVLFLWHRAGLLSRRARLQVAVVFVALFALAVNMHIYRRFEQAFRDYQVFTHQGIWDNSAGQRLLMWESGLKAAAKKPWFGWGMHRTQQAAASELKDPAVIAQVLEHHNLHNEYVNTLAGRGLVGLLSLLALLGVPYGLCMRRARDPRRLALCGIGALLSLGYAVSGLTFQAFGDDAMNVIYALFLSFSLAGLYRPGIATNTAPSGNPAREAL